MSTHVKYFRIMVGLRGCYMPDCNYTVRAAQRRGLKEAITAEAKHQSCDGTFMGFSKATLAWAAARAWINGDAIVPFGRRGGDRPYAIEISRITPREFKEAQLLEEANA